MKRWIIQGFSLLIVGVLIAGCALTQPPATAQPNPPGRTTPAPGEISYGTAYPVSAGGSGSSSGSGIITAQAGSLQGTSYPGTGSGGVDASGNLVITTESGGQTYTIKRGQRFTIKLGEVYNWQVSVDPAGVIEPVMGLALARGVQGVYVGKSPGRAAIQMVGDPTCRKSNPPCGMPSLMLTVTIEVK